MQYNVKVTARKDKADKHGKLPIYIYVYQGANLVAKKSLKQKVLPDNWDISTCRVTKKAPLSSLVNSVIDKEVSDIKTKMLQGSIIGEEVNLSEILNVTRVSGMDFFKFAEKQIVEKNYAPETRRNYRVYTDKIREYKPSLKLSDINYKFLQGYESYLRDTLCNSHNTVWGNFKFINTMIKDAIKSKYLKDDPFKVYGRPKYKQTKRTFLSAEEVETVLSFFRTAKDSGLKIVSGYFLFMCYTGLRISDATRFRSDTHIVDGQRIVIETQKTKQVTNLYINNQVREFAGFVNDNPLGICEQEFNRRLKIIASAIGIGKRITSHVARHTFGASLAALGVPEKAAQGLLAHGSAASTRIYFHMQTPTLDEAMKRFDK